MARSVIAGILGIAFAIAILFASGLLVGGGPGLSLTVQSTAQKGANTPLYASTQGGSSSPNTEPVYGAQPSPQAISNLSVSSVGSLMLLGAASLAIGFGFMIFLSRRLK